MKQDKSYCRICQQEDEPTSQQEPVVAVCCDGKYRTLDDIQ